MAPAASGGGLFGAGGSSQAPAFGAEKPKAEAAAAFGAPKTASGGGGLFSQPRKPEAPQQQEAAKSSP